MRCHEATELMSLQLDQMLDQAGRQKLDAHLSECTTCQQTWAAMREVSTLLASAPMVAPAPGFTQRVKVRLAKRQSRRQLIMGYLVLAAGLLLLAALPLTQLAVPVSNMGRAVAQEPDMVNSGLSLVARLGSIAGSMLEACWLLVRSVLGILPAGILLPGLMASGLLVALWVYLISGRVVPKSTARS